MMSITEKEQLLEYQENVGKKVQKCSITRNNNREIRNPFKSGFMINTITGVIDHPILNIPAYTFEEDNSYVECRKCETL